MNVELSLKRARNSLTAAILLGCLLISICGLSCFSSASSSDRTATVAAGDRKTQNQIENPDVNAGSSLKSATGQHSSSPQASTTILEVSEQFAELTDPDGVTIVTPNESTQHVTTPWTTANTSGAPRVTVPVTINVNNGDLVRELIQVQARIARLESGESSTDASKSEDQNLRFFSTEEFSGTAVCQTIVKPAHSSVAVGTSEVSGTSNSSVEIKESASINAVSSSQSAALSSTIKLQTVDLQDFFGASDSQSDSTNTTEQIAADTSVSARARLPQDGFKAVRGLPPENLSLGSANASQGLAEAKAVATLSQPDSSNEGQNVERAGFAVPVDPQLGRSTSGYGLDARDADPEKPGRYTYQPPSQFQHNYKGPSSPSATAPSSTVVERSPNWFKYKPRSSRSRIEPSTAVPAIPEAVVREKDNDYEERRQADLPLIPEVEPEQFEASEPTRPDTTVPVPTETASADSALESNTETDTPLFGSLPDIDGSDDGTNSREPRVAENIKELKPVPEMLPPRPPVPETTEHGLYETQQFHSPSTPTGSTVTYSQPTVTYRPPQKKSESQLPFATTFRRIQKRITHLKSEMIVPDVKGREIKAPPTVSSEAKVLEFEFHDVPVPTFVAPEWRLPQLQMPEWVYCPPKVDLLAPVRNSTTLHRVMSTMEHVGKPKSVR